MRHSFKLITVNFHFMTLMLCAGISYFNINDLKLDYIIAFFSGENFDEVVHSSPHHILCRLHCMGPLMGCNDHVVKWQKAGYVWRLPLKYIQPQPPQSPIRQRRAYGVFVHDPASGGCQRRCKNAHFRRLNLVGLWRWGKPYFSAVHDRIACLQSVVFAS
mgnify:CR=1 FL=1